MDLLQTPCSSTSLHLPLHHSLVSNKAASQPVTLPAGPHYLLHRALNYSTAFLYTMSLTDLSSHWAWLKNSCQTLDRVYFFLCALHLFTGLAHLLSPLLLFWLFFLLFQLDPAEEQYRKSNLAEWTIGGSTRGRGHGATYLDDQLNKTNPSLFT